MSYKKQTVNESTPFLSRARCKFCGKFPQHYFCTKNKTWHKDPNIIIDYFNSKWINIEKNFFISVLTEHYSPYELCSIGELSYYPQYKSYNPSFHSKSGIQGFFDVTEYLACPCGKTRWAFYQRTSKDRYEIVNRKCRNNYRNIF